jgi:hypothetical protein
LQSPRWPKPLAIKGPSQRKVVMFSAVASVVPVVKKLLAHQMVAQGEVSKTARPPPWLVSEGAEVRLVQETLAAWRPAWPMLSETFLVVLEAQVPGTMVSAVRRVPSLAPDSPSLGSPMASIG